MDALHYSRCIMVPTGSSLAFQLGLLPTGGPAGGDVPVVLELGDYEHEDDRLWMRHAGLTKHIWNRSRGADTQVVGFSMHLGNGPIWSLPDSPVKTPADLKGRRCAMIRTPGALFDIDRSVFLKPYVYAAKSAGLSLGDLCLAETTVERAKVQNETPSGPNFFQQVGEIFVGQLLRGDVDAIATPLPAETVHRLDLHKVYDTRDDPDIAARAELRAVVVSGPALREQRPLVVEMVRKIVQAGDWGAEHPDAILLRLAKDLSVDEAVLRNRGIDGLALTRLGLEARMLALAAEKKSFMLETGLIDQDFSLAEWVDGTVLAEASQGG
jgi:ABC-type nitrate/sulfonate/bicarbonate transport system substrate-binding protein